MRTVLLVDSSEAFLRVMELLLRRLGYHVRTAPTAAACIEELSHAPTDLVMTEELLPDGRGTDLGRRILQGARTAATRVVIVSTDNSPATRARAEAAGCAGYITKPVTVRSVFAVLERLRGLRRRQHLRARLALEAAVTVGGERFPLTTLNFGEGGVFLGTPAPRPVGEVVFLSIAIPGRETPLELQAEVIYAIGAGVKGHPPGMGVRFLDPDPRQREFLASFLERTLAGSEAGDRGRRLPASPADTSARAPVA